MHISPQIKKTKIALCRDKLTSNNGCIYLQQVYGPRYKGQFEIAVRWKRPVSLCIKNRNPRFRNWIPAPGLVITSQLLVPFVIRRFCSRVQWVRAQSFHYTPVLTLHLHVVSSRTGCSQSNSLMRRSSNRGMVLSMITMSAEDDR